MGKIIINDINKGLYYGQFLSDFCSLPVEVKDSCGDSLILPLLFKQITQDYEFTKQAEHEYELFSNGRLIARMDDMGLRSLSLPALRYYKDTDSDYVLGTNWMGNLINLDLPNLETSVNGFLRYAFNLQKVYAPEWSLAGDFTLFAKDRMLSVLHAPCLHKAGKHCHSLVYETIRQNRVKHK